MTQMHKVQQPFERRARRRPQVLGDRQHLPTPAASPVDSPQVDFFFLFFLPTSVIVRAEDLVRQGLVWQLAVPGLTQRTRRKALFELVGFLGVLQHEGVKVFLAPDLELDVLTLLVLLDARRCEVLAASRPDCCAIASRCQG